MALKKPTGDMYPFVDWIWNPVCGKCLHDCPYCYVKRIISGRFKREQQKPHLVPSEFKINLGVCNTIFVCSGCDLFANDVPDDYIKAVFNHTYVQECVHKRKNKYIFQTKNPKRLTFSPFKISADIHKFCTTIETNYHLTEYMGNTPTPYERAEAMYLLSEMGFETMVTIEPIMEFDLEKMLDLISLTRAAQVNIGADSGNNHLPEPPKEKVIKLISELKKFTNVYEKENLRRLMA